MTKKEEQVKEILLTPIKCKGSSKGKPTIKKVNSILESTQTYTEMLDEDMSGFAVDFYEITLQHSK